MSYKKNRRIKNRRREKKDGKYIQGMKNNHIENMANKKINWGLLRHAMGEGRKKVKEKKENKGLVEKFKRLFKIKIKK